MKKILLSLFIACCFLLPLSGAEAVNGSKQARELWQKISDTSKNLQNLECDAHFIFNTSYEKTKITIPISCHMTIWQTPMQAKVFFRSILPGGAPVNIDYYILEEGADYHVYFQHNITAPQNQWHKMSVPIKRTDEKLEKQLRELVDKEVTVKLRGKEEIDGQVLSKIQISIKNRVIYDLMQLSGDEMLKQNPAFTPEAIEAFYRDYLSKLGDLSYTVWADQDGIIYKADFDFASMIKKGIKVLEKVTAKEKDESVKAQKQTFIDMLKHTTITGEFTYSNYNKAGQFVLPEEAKTAQEIKLPAAPPQETAQPNKGAV